MNFKTDFLIVGAGITGLAVAHEIKKRLPKADIIIIEKENQVAFHASGRNSGVIHAGIYYVKDSLKARFTVEGNRQMKIFCAENNIRINPCGKLIVAKNEEEMKTLEELYHRGLGNGVNLKKITIEEMNRIDANARSFGFALFSPNTASVDPVEVCHKLQQKLTSTGVRFLFNTCFKSNKNKTVQVTEGNITYKTLINCAGLYADQVARYFGVGLEYLILPFKGRYLNSEGDRQDTTVSIYPVPDLKYPFLGVHFTKTVDGKTKIGPTAMPAFWKESYGGISRISFKEILLNSYWLTTLFLRNPGNFRELAFREIQYLSKRKLLKEGAELVKNLQGKYHKKAPGIRAQLFNKRTLKLEMDFLVLPGPDSLHVLNAVSPAFTCAFSFAAYIVDMLNSKSVK